MDSKSCNCGSEFAKITGHGSVKTGFSHLDDSAGGGKEASTHFREVDEYQTTTKYRCSKCGCRWEWMGYYTD